MFSENMGWTIVLLAYMGKINMTKLMGSRYRTINHRQSTKARERSLKGH